MDCESCGQHRPSGQVIAARSSNGTVLMVCGRCRRHVRAWSSTLADLRRSPGDAHRAAEPA